MSGKIQGTIKPVWDEIDEARQKCINFLSDNKLPVEVIDAISMVVHELLENALKYGNYKNNDMRITYTLQAGEKNIIIEVSNPIYGDDAPHFKILDKTIQWIRGYQNPFEAYAAKLKDVSVKPLKDKESCLALVRVAYEGQSILDFYIREDNYICVSAVYQLH